MTIKHRQGRSHGNADRPSRIPTRPPLGYTDPSPDAIHTLIGFLADAYPVLTSTLELNSQLLDDFRQYLPEDPAFRKIIAKITAQQLSTADDLAAGQYHLFSLQDGILYHTRDSHTRICVPYKLQREIFAIVHNSYMHVGLQWAL
jgi:hypothetical protein